MYAVIKTGGKQYRVAAGEKLKIEQITADVGQEITLDHVLAIGSGADLQIGSPLVTGASDAPPQALPEASGPSSGIHGNRNPRRQRLKFPIHRGVTHGTEKRRRFHAERP